jgi:hypothetical protein
MGLDFPSNLTGSSESSALDFLDLLSFNRCSSTGMARFSALFSRAS